MVGLLRFSLATMNSPISYEQATRYCHQQALGTGAADPVAAVWHLKALCRWQWKPSSEDQFQARFAMQVWLLTLEMQFMPLPGRSLRQG